MSVRTTHYRERMSGRDPHETHRVATPLELLFDLVFVVAFGAAADELAHAMAVDHVGDGLIGFAFATFAISWAWINFAWFASAYDTDDWIFRLTTMVQMVGVLVLALGLPDVFESLAADENLDNRVMVAGYVVMRISMVAQWWRASRHDEARRPICLIYLRTLLLAQAGWIVVAILDLPLGTTLACVLVLVGIEVTGPALAERRHGSTPWHAHHVAERYGLLVIITLGEAVLGTAVAVRAVIGPDGPGWSTDVVVLGVAGIVLTFGIWWCYFVIPWGHFLQAHPERSFGFGFGHIPVFGALAAVGAGLHSAAYYLDHDTYLGPTATLLTVAVPVAVFAPLLYAIFALFTRTWDPFHSVLIGATAVVVAGSIALVAAGVPLVWGLAALALAPWVTVVGYELVGHRHNEELLASLAE